jgi:hypothetical protein
MHNEQFLMILMYFGHSGFTSLAMQSEAKPYIRSCVSDDRSGRNRKRFLARRAEESFMLRRFACYADKTATRVNN